MSDKEYSLRQSLVSYAKQLNNSGLSAGKSGNISIRDGETIFITPSGVDYDLLSPESIVAMDLKGNYAQDKLKPSSEWHFHCGVYQARTDVNALVHTHSTYCTALACTGKPIPAFHYMVAIAGGSHIPITPYALFGTEQLSRYVVDALEKVSACLMANHGMIALGHDVSSAFNLAQEVENLAQQYYCALQVGNVNLLSDQQMQEVLEKFSSYGQRV